MPSTISDLFKDSPGEFFLSVEVFVTNAANVPLSKPSTKGRKLEKRESVGDDLKAKERVGTGEPFAQKGRNDAGRWKAATCRLTEDKERCILSIYVDGSILHQTIFIHLLNQTDIRPTELSLFSRKNCISIIPKIGRCLTPSSNTNPTHLAFPSSDTCATWQALLKSYAIPETYGRNLVPMEGGFYRLWRQVDLTVIQGRNLGSTNTEAVGNSEECSADVSCEIHLNDILCSRTTVKKVAASMDWYEHFSFPGLPPFEKLEIVVFKERHSSKPLNLGSACITLCNFRRGEFVEGWFPVVRQIEALGVENYVGELQLKIRVDEEVILPSSCYARLMDSFQSRNFLDWISDLERCLKLKDISADLMSIAIANNTIVEQIQQYVSREVENSPTSHQTLFRGNTRLTKIVELSMSWYGKSFLEASVGSVLRRLCAEKVSIEIDPVRRGRGQKDAEKNVEQLVYWCREFWNQIYSVRADCPNEIRHICETIRKVVEQRYHADSISADAQSHLPWQCVSAFVFLRFIVPAILHPHLFGLHPGLPSLPVQRSLTLIAKVIQSLANLNVASHKENFMRGVQEFLKDSFHGMMDYISVVSTPVSEGVSSIGNDDTSRHIRHVSNDLRQRTRTMAVLNRESIPALPHLLDIPRHLACISSAVVRKSKESTLVPQPGDDVDKVVDEFCARCFEVEEETFSRVDRIATKIRVASTEDSSHLFVPEPPTRSDAQDRKRYDYRPATAPSLADLESHRSARNEDEYPTPVPKHQWNMQKKSPSTDSLPKMVNEKRTPTFLPPTTPTTEKDVDTGKWKKGLFRGILKR